MEKICFIKQHPNDGKSLINLSNVVSIGLSDDSIHAKAVLTNNEIVRLDIDYDTLLNKIDIIK